MKLLPHSPTVVLSGVLKGVYAAGTDYAPGEVVTYQGGTYIMHTDAAAGTLPTDTTKWQAINSPQAYVESIDQLTLVNTGTDNTISIDANGNVGTDVSTDGALHIENTGNAGIGLGVYSNAGAEASAPLVNFKADNTAFDQPVLQITQDGNSEGIKIIGSTAASTAPLMSLTDASTSSGNQTLKVVSARNGGASIAAIKTESSGFAAGIFIDHNSNGVGLRIDNESTTVDGLVIESDALTTGSIARLSSDSADTGTRALVEIINDNVAAVNVTPLLVQQDAPTSTNYFRIANFGGITIWAGNGNTANGVLSGAAGDLLLNGSDGKPEYCTGTTNWTTLV